MTGYRRLYIKGGCYFFTVAIHNRHCDMLIKHIDLLREAFRQVQQNHPFYIHAIVILPDHLHCIWSLPQNDYNFSLRWRLIKGYFSRRLPKREPINHSRKKKHERAIWQRRFWERVIRDEEEFNEVVTYIHTNPIKHGYCEHAEQWPYSSVHHWARCPRVIPFKSIWMATG